MNKENLLERITKESDKRGGKPCIKGTRISVYDILSYLASGMSEREVLDDFPYLEENDIRACFAYEIEQANSGLKDT